MELSRFMRVYSFLPLEERNLPILTIDNEPISWKRAHEEIKNKTKLGEKVFKKLVDKRLI
jgi:hypothetical protein